MVLQPIGRLCPEPTPAINGIRSKAKSRKSRYEQTLESGEASIYVLASLYNQIVHQVADTDDQFINGTHEKRTSHLLSKANGYILMMMLSKPGNAGIAL